MFLLTSSSVRFKHYLFPLRIPFVLMYQSMVALRPSSKGVLASKAKVLFGSGCVKTTSRLAIRLGTVPPNLAAGGLIKLHRLIARTNRLEQPKCSKGISISGVDWHIKTYPNMALCPKVINLIRLNLIYNC